MTQQDLIADALTEIGVNSVGETPSAEDLRVASRILSQMFDSFQAMRLYIFAIQRQVLVPATLKQTYTLGSGGDFNIPRPARITRYGVINLSNPQQPLELPLDSLTEAQWMSIPVKGIASALPQRVWDDNNYPLRNLNFWPVPNVQINFTIYQWIQLPTWPDYVTDVTFAPGYQEFIKYELAKRCLPSFGAAAMWSPTSEQMYVAAKNRVMVMNAPLIDLMCDPMLQSPESGIYNWLTDNANVGSGN
jgi:hypothetical protein